MSVAAGTRIGPYQVTSLIGAGGMGEVYRARDTALGRDVALKVLPAAFAQDAERIARFRREAQVLASLNHPGIAAIYGLESSGSVSALALEFVDGDDLSAIIARGPLPIDDAIDVARQIAEALEAAHDAGVVHRDLKPANIKRRADGSVKVLDFGLAKAVDPAGSGQSGAASTQTSPAMTGIGMILGTAAYMSPEQAKGRSVDRRADIWAFGVVLFEMLTGRQLFAGETVSEVLAAVLRQDLDWTPLPRETRPSVRRLLERCLDRDPRTRLRDIGEARVALASPALAAGASAAPSAPSHGLRAPIWVTAAVAIASAVAAALWFRGGSPPAPAVARFDVAPPAGTTLSLAIRPAVSIAPDGSTVVFAAARAGITQLYRRRRGDPDATALTGTEGASNPVISPDGRAVAFFADNTLKTVPLPFDGPVSTVVGGLNDPRGVTWVDESTMVYGPNATDGLMKIRIGGTPAPFSTLDGARNERTHRWPVALAGGRAVAFTVGTMASPDSYEDAAIDLVVVATGERRPQFLKGASMIVGDAGESLFFARGGVIHSVAFDAGRLTTSGQPVPLVPGITGDVTTGAAQAALAADGTLIYVPGESAMGTVRRLVWVDGSSTATPLPGLPDALYNDIRLSPDGSKIAVIVGASGSGDVWLYDIAATTFTRLTFTGRNSSPLFSADSRTVYYADIDPTGLHTVVWRRPADGSRDAERVAGVDSRANLTVLEKDSVIVDYYGLVQSKTNVVRIPFTAGAKPETLAGTPFDEYSAALSPDRRWLAYQSDDTGRFEIYVRDLWPAGGRRQVSTTLGEEPKWSPDGHTLYYRADDVVMAVPIDTTGGTFSAGKPRAFARGAYNLRSDTGISYDVDRKLPRLVMIRPAVDRQTPPTVRVVLNWLAELTAKAGR
jgi:serine/threonine-protein kinase